MTASAPASSSIGAETSPVKAPEASSCTFWAATLTAVPEQRSATARRARKEGQITTSGPSAPGAPGRKAPRYCSASATVLLIFQFAAT